MRDAGLVGVGVVLGWLASKTWSDPACQLGLVVFLIAAAVMTLGLLVAVVVPWTITATSAAPAAAPARAPCTPPAWLATVVGTLATRTSPVAPSTHTRSVKVPPTSTPTSLVWVGPSGDMG